MSPTYQHVLIGKENTRIGIRRRGEEILYGTLLKTNGGCFIKVEKSGRPDAVVTEFVPFEHITGILFED